MATRQLILPLNEDFVHYKVELYHKTFKTKGYLQSIMDSIERENYRITKKQIDSAIKTMYECWYYCDKLQRK